MIPLERFLQLETEEVAEIVRTSGTKVCVFPFNGTRRWFLLEHSDELHNQPAAYVETTIQGYVRVYKMLFDHGIETVLAPVFGKEILTRGEKYMTLIGDSMKLLAQHPEFTSLYKDYQVRVRFYGDFRKELDAQYRHITEAFDTVTEQTLRNDKHRLLYGVFASDAAQIVAELSIEYYQRHNRTPTRDELVKMYYGEDLEKADLFIGFEKFAAFDYPLLQWGNESLYFTIAPSLYITQTLLRKILHDHVYQRPTVELDYDLLTEDERTALRNYYRRRRDDAHGVGQMVDGIWYGETHPSGGVA
jgi:tuberculosinol/isotuberculosinol synthase